MPSTARQFWFSARAAALDEIEDAHRAVGGTSRGRRYATQQLNYAYAVLLSAQFQGFCRDLHTECVDYLVAAFLPAWYRTTLREEFLLNRKIDRGNPNPSNLGGDFDRLGLNFWTALSALDPRTTRRRQLLEEVNQWRNAIAHQDFSPSLLRAGHPTLRLARVQLWRKACDGLVRSFDRVAGQFIQRVSGSAPW